MKEYLLPATIKKNNVKLFVTFVLQKLSFLVKCYLADRIETPVKKLY